MSPTRLPSILLTAALAATLSSSPAISQGPPAAEHDLPACRIDRQLPRVVIRTAQSAFAAVAKRHPGTLRRLAINDLSSKPGELSLLFVRDALEGSTDAQGCPRSPIAAGDGSLRSFDPLSVQGICVADSGEVRCSSDAVRALIAIEQEQPSPTLLFLLAHELAHVALGHPGAFNQASASLDLASPQEEKIRSLSDLCRIDRSQLEREEQADGEALAVMGELFVRRPFRRRGQSAFDAIAGHGETVYQTSRELAGWAGLHYGAIESDPVTDHPCELVLGREGSLNVPVYGGSHPHIQDRLSRIVNTIGDYVNELPFTDEDLIDLQGSLAILNINRLTDGVRAIALQQATDQFCAAVDELEAGSLDCASWTPSEEESGLFEVELPAMEGPPDWELPLTPPAVPGPYREVPAGEARALVLYLDTFRSFPREAQAQAAAPRLVEAHNQFSVALESRLKSAGGFWLTEHRKSVVISYSPLSNTYHVNGLIWGILRVPKSFEPEQLAGWGELAVWGARYQILPWEDFRNETVLHFLTRTPSDLGDKRLLTRELGLDQMFDRARAVAGERDAISPLFADLLRFARERLERKYGELFTLDDPEGEDDPFYIAFRGDAVNKNLYLPKSWIAVALESRSEPKHPAGELASLLSRLFDYGQDSRQLSPEEFSALFH